VITIATATIALKEVPRHQGLNVHECTLRRWVREGRLATIKKGGRVYTSKRAIEALCQRSGEQ